nr:MAG TPA: hypothetical protein [Caudoviricetes sp.]
MLQGNNITRLYRTKKSLLKNLVICIVLAQSLIRHITIRLKAG